VSVAGDEVDAEARAAAGAPDAGPAPRQAAVLVPVFRDAHGDIRIVLIHRAPGGMHGDQIAFPGGGAESIDASLFDTALRESREEIGLDPSTVELLATLPVLTTRATGFSIAPFLGRIVRPEHWVPHQREIADVFEPRLAELADPAQRDEMVLPYGPGGQPRTFPFIHIEGHRLWGASYHILAPVLPRLVAGEWTI
jgi:8-oxo-dGTP pyrophosphatase MutT (NUDIX family)